MWGAPWDTQPVMLLLDDGAAPPDPPDPPAGGTESQIFVLRRTRGRS